MAILYFYGQETAKKFSCLPINLPSIYQTVKANREDTHPFLMLKVNQKL